MDAINVAPRSAATRRAKRVGHSAVSTGADIEPDQLETVAPRLIKLMARFGSMKVLASPPLR
jgi:hypothetical protein